jgi:aldehyde:ferredoxin oxidoreductase
MGSKNLKAIAVLGSRQVVVAEPDELDAFIKRKAPEMNHKLLVELECRKNGNGDGLCVGYVLGIKGAEESLFAG